MEQSEYLKTSRRTTNELETENASTPDTKRVLLYGWDGLNKVRLAVDALGLVKVDASTLPYLKLDQTIPQTTVGTFTFPAGIFGAGSHASIPSTIKLLVADDSDGRFGVTTDDWGTFIKPSGIYAYDYGVGGGPLEIYLNEFGGEVVIGNDNQKLYFGDDWDSAIYFDGTNLVIDALEGGASGTDFKANNLTTTGSFGAGAITGTSLTDSGLTTPRIPYASTGGLLADSANFGLISPVNTSYVAIGVNSGTTKLNGFTINPIPIFTGTGTISYVNVSNVVNGVGTKFLTEVGVGDFIYHSDYPNNPAKVVSITSDTVLGITGNFSSLGGFSDHAYTISKCVLVVNGSASTAALGYSSFRIRNDGTLDFNNHIAMENGYNIYGAGNFTVAAGSVDTSGSLIFTRGGVSQIVFTNLNKMAVPSGYNTTIATPTLLFVGLADGGLGYNLGTCVIEGQDNFAWWGANKGGTALDIKAGANLGNNVTGGFLNLYTGEVLASGSTVQTKYARLKLGITEATFNEDGRDYDLRIEGDTDANLFTLDASTDSIGIGVASPLAWLHLKAGTTAKAPLMLTSGTNLSSALSGAVEYDGTNLYFTNSSPARLTLATLTGTQTLTNKKITPRVVTTTDDASAEIDVTVTDVYELTAVANATTFTLSGTAVDGQKIMIRFKDAGVAKALTWTGFTAIGVTLPTTTVVSKWHYVGITYNASATAWHAIAVGVEA